jgi:hypothetical protein
MDHLWAPVGTGIRPQEETDFVVAYLFNDQDGGVALKEMDGTIAELPGLDGTHYLSEAAARSIDRQRGVSGRAWRATADREGGPSCLRRCP